VKAVINPHFLEQTRFDSAAPSGTAVVAHRFDDDGDYQLAVARGNTVVTTAQLSVVAGRRTATEEAAAEPATAGRRRDAISVDVSQLLAPAGTPSELPTVASAGWVSLTSTQPVPGHHMVVRRVKDAKPQRGSVFDSRRLDEPSVFAVTLLQPGRYSLENAIGGTKAEIVVSYPTPGARPYRPPAPLQVEVTEDGFGSQRISLAPAQGIVFRFRTQSRIQIELVEPDEGPPREPRPRARLTRSPRAS